MSASGGTAPYTYSWNPSGQTTPTANNLASGNYTVTVKDANNCSHIFTANVGMASGFSLTPSQANVSCNGENNGAATANPSAGTPPFTFSWAPTSQVTATATGLTANIYTVTVYDANSCSSTTTVTITQPPVLNASVSSNPTSCGSTNGTATAPPSGGTAP